MSKNLFTYRIIWSEEDQEFVGLCAEFPSLSWLDESRSAALDGIVKLVHSVVRDLKKNKEPVPDPISTRKFSGRFQARIPPHVHRRLTIRAAEEGRSMNSLISSILSHG